MASKGTWYAWVIAGSTFLLGIGTICGTMSWGYVAPYIAEEFGTTVADIAIGTSLYGILCSGLGFLAGSLGDRFGPRIVCTVGSVGLGVFLILAGTISTSVIITIVLYALAGAFASACGGILMPKLIASWFAPNMRGKGMVINTLGGSISGAVLGIVAPLLIINSGWKGCFFWLGVVITICGILYFLLARDTPAKMGTVPLGSPPGTEVIVEPELTPEEKAAQKAASRMSSIRVLKMPITWIFGVMCIVWQFYFMGVNAFQTAAILEAGYDIQVAGLIGTITIGVLAVSQIVCSSLSDKFSRKKIFGFLCVGSGIMLVVVYFVLGLDEPNLLLLYGVFVILGCFSGNAPIMQNLYAEVYPPDLRGSGPGMIGTITLVGMFFGPLIAAAFVNMSGGVSATAILFGGISLTIAGLIAWIFFPNTGGKYGDPLAEQYNAELEKKAVAATEEASAGE